MSMFRFCTLVFTCMPGKLIQSVRIDLQQAAYIPVVFSLNWKSHVYKTKCETLRKHLFYFYNVQNKHLCASPSSPYEAKKHYHGNDTYIYINSRNLHRTQHGIPNSHIPLSIVLRRKIWSSINSNGKSLFIFRTETVFFLVFYNTSVGQVGKVYTIIFSTNNELFYFICR